jgi:hypothetical protein
MIQNNKLLFIKIDISLKKSHMNNKLMKQNPQDEFPKPLHKKMVYTLIYTPFFTE